MYFLLEGQQVGTVAQQLLGTERKHKKRCILFSAVVEDKNFCVGRVTHTHTGVHETYTTDTQPQTNTHPGTHTHTHTQLADIMFDCPAGLLPVSVCVGNRQC